MGGIRIFRRCPVTLLAVFLLLTNVTAAHAANTDGGIRNEAQSSGLQVTARQPDVDISNLNPGDSLNASLLLENTGPYTLTVYLQTKIDSEISPMGGALADQMELTIDDGDSSFCRDDTFRNAAAKAIIPIGVLKPGGKKQLSFNAGLPGATTDNRWQGASLQVEWIFTSTYSTSSGGGGGGENGGSGGGGSGGGGGSTPIGTISIPPGSQASSTAAATTSQKTSSSPSAVPVVSPATGENSFTPVKIFCALTGLFLAGGAFLLSVKKLRHS